MARGTKAFVAVTVAIVLATGAYLALAIADRPSDEDKALPPAASPSGDLPGDTVFVRDTRDGADYGRIDLVSGGERTTTQRRCDRIDVTSSLTMACLEAIPGVTPRAKLSIVAPDGAVEKDWKLAGVPSRTRLSPTGRFWAATTFVEGHSYASARFSTLTVVGSTDGGKPVNLEDYDLMLDGKSTAPVDRNFWGVTFAKDDRTFYATVSTGKRIRLVKGDLRSRTVTSVHDDVECPALSPDETRVAYKVRDALAGTTWSLAVLDLATGEETLLEKERSSVDDQPMWLDDDTVLYGLPQHEKPGFSDVWAIDVSGDRAPRLYVEGASSPAVPHG